MLKLYEIRIAFLVASVVFLFGMVTTIHATSDSGILMLLCGNNPIHNKYNVEGVTAGNIINGCKERLDGYSWGSRIYILIYAPGWNTDPDKLDVIGNNSDNPITAVSKDGKMSLEGDGCNGFIETAPDHGLFFGSVKLSGFRHDISGDGRPDLFGGNRCHKNSSIIDDGSGRVEARQEGGVTVSFEYFKDKFVSKSATYSWRDATLEFDKTKYDVSDEIHLTLNDLDNLRWPFDNKKPYQVHVYSDTDTSGILVDAYWVPNYKGIVQMNGHYPIKLYLTFDDKSEESSSPFGFSRGLLRVSPGDAIYAEYQDYSLPRPYGMDEQKKVLATAQVNNVSFDGFPLEISSKVMDGDGNPLSHCIKDIVVKIKTDVTNTKNKPVSAHIITKIKDSNNITQHLSLSTISIAPDKVGNINSEWVVKNNGTHTFEIFVFDNTGKYGSLSESLRFVI